MIISGMSCQPGCLTCKLSARNVVRVLNDIILYHTLSDFVAAEFSSILRCGFSHHAYSFATDDASESVTDLRQIISPNQCKKVKLCGTVKGDVVAVAFGD